MRTKGIYYTDAEQTQWARDYRAESWRDKQFYERLADMWETSRPNVVKRIQTLKRNGYLTNQTHHRVMNPPNMFRFSNDVLAHATDSKEVRAVLAGKWGISQHTVKDRVKQLRSEGWLVGTWTHVMPGPAYRQFKERT